MSRSSTSLSGQFVLLGSDLPELPPQEDGTQLWEVLYEGMGIFRLEDESGQLALLCQVRMAAIQELYDLMRERPGIPAGALLLDPQNAPVKNLGYQAQYVGARLTANMDEAQIRAEIEQPMTWRRGMTDAIELVGRREIEGTEWIRVRPRWPGFGGIYVRTLASETPDPARVELELLDPRWGIPAWEVLDYRALGAIGYVDMEVGWRTYAEVEAAFATYKAAEEVKPEQLPR